MACERELYNVHMRNLEEFNQRYAGETCFVVGAGPSLHFQDLKSLEDEYVIAVNSGYLAVPKATFFVSDDWAVANWSYVFKDLRDSDKTIALLYESKLKGVSDWFGDRSVMFKHRSGYKFTKTYSHTKSKQHIGQARSSVGTAIQIAYTMGFSNIVMLGMDCRRHNGFRYFWQLERKNQPYRNDGVPIDKYPRRKDGNIPSDKDLMEIKRAWSLISDNVPKDLNVYNGSEMSILTHFQKVNFQDYLHGQVPVLNNS